MNIFKNDGNKLLENFSNTFDYMLDVYVNMDGFDPIDNSEVLLMISEMAKIEMRKIEHRYKINKELMAQFIYECSVIAAKSIAKAKRVGYVDKKKFMKDTGITKKDFDTLFKHTTDLCFCNLLMKEAGN